MKKCNRRSAALFVRYLPFALIAAVMVGCGTDVTPTTNSAPLQNETAPQSPPSISGTPPTTVVAGTRYSFQPSAACFQAGANSTRYPLARASARTPGFPAVSASTDMAGLSQAAFGRSMILPGCAVSRRKSIGRRALRSRLTHLPSRSSFCSTALAKNDGPRMLRVFGV